MGFLLSQLAAKFQCVVFACRCCGTVAISAICFSLSGDNKADLAQDGHLHHAFLYMDGHFHFTATQGRAFHVPRLPIPGIEWCHRFAHDLGVLGFKES